MFKKFCRSGYIVFLLYAFGAGFWIGALFSSTYKLFFCAAIICIIVGFVRSLPWIWKHHIFERPHLRSPYSRRYSDRHPNPHSDIVSQEYAKTHGERRRHRRRKPEKRKRLRWTAEVISILLFIAAGLGLENSYAIRTYKEAPVIDVLLSDRKQIAAARGQKPTVERVRARHAPFLGRNAPFRNIVFSLADTPTEDVLINKEDKSAKIDVILKDLNGIDVPNAHVTVESDVPINPVTEDLVSLTDTQLYGDVAHVTPADHSSDERVITVEIPIPQKQDTAGIYVSIQGDNLKSYGAVARVFFVKNLDASPSPHAAGSLAESPH
jgi:hypothetical protein